MCSGLKKIKRICIRIVKNKGKVTEEASYYISNSKDSTKKSLVILRKHWKIESMALYIDLFFVFEFMK